MNKLEKLQKITNVLKKESTEKEQFDFKPASYSQENLGPFNKYIKNDEEILLFYYSKIKSYKIVFSLILTIIGLISLLSINYIIKNIPLMSFIGLSLFTLIAIGAGLIAIGPIWLSKLLSQIFNKYLFTTQKIIIKRYGKIGFTPYGNISSITYDNKKKIQHININLKSGLDGDELGDTRIISISYVPLKEQLFRKINYIKESYSK
ncbi:hypothetical protein ES705_27659 [subsurface metagenome]